MTVKGLFASSPVMMVVVVVMMMMMTTTMTTMLLLLVLMISDTLGYDNRIFVVTTLPFGAK